MAVMMYAFRNAAGNFAYSYFTGLFFDLYGVVTLMHVIIQYSLTTLLIFVIMEVVVRIFGNRPHPDDESNEEWNGSSITVPLNALPDHTKHDELRLNDKEIDLLKT